MGNFILRSQAEIKQSADEAATRFYCILKSENIDDITIFDRINLMLELYYPFISNESKNHILAKY